MGMLPASRYRDTGNSNPQIIGGNAGRNGFQTARNAADSF